MSRHKEQSWPSRLVLKVRAAIRAAFEPNMTLPGVFGVMVFIGADKAAFVNNSDRVLGHGPAAYLITPALMGLYAYTSLLVFTQLRIKYKVFENSGTSFFVAAFLSAVLNVVLIEATLGLNVKLALSNGVRIFVATFFVAILVGQYRRWVSRELFKNIGLLASIKQQRNLLIQADENARRDIAKLLHDSVQSKLVVSATKLDQLSEKAPATLARELKDLIGDLEKIRSLDVRTASRTLSPDIEIMGLEKCLEELANVYADSMSVKLQVKGLTGQAESKTGLALYRICEQGLLNALTHGSAKTCLVTLWIEDNWVRLELENDGAKLETVANPAQGSAVIDAWVASFEGDWSLADISDYARPAKLAGGTVRLSAKLNFDALP